MALRLLYPLSATSRATRAARSPWLRAMSDLFRGADAAAPIRGEILGPSDLEAAAVRLAKGHDLLPARRSGRPLLSRLEDNQRALRAARQAILGAVRRNETITPAAEWLSENFHVVEEQVRAVRGLLVAVELLLD